MCTPACTRMYMSTRVPACVCAPHVHTHTNTRRSTHTCVPICTRTHTSTHRSTHTCGYQRPRTGSPRTHAETPSHMLTSSRGRGSPCYTQDSSGIKPSGTLGATPIPPLRPVSNRADRTLRRLLFPKMLTRPHLLERQHLRRTPPRPGELRCHRHPSEVNRGILESSGPESWLLHFFL